MALPNAHKKRYSLFVLGILLLLIMPAMLVLGTHNFLIRTIGTCALFGSLYLIRISNVKRFPYTTVSDIEQETQSTESVGHFAHHAPFTTINDLGVDPRSAKRTVRLIWVVGVVLLVLTMISLLLLQRDQANGGNEIWPLDVFVIVGIADIVYGAYLAIRFSQR
jgi:hypothetical protein